MPGSAQFSPYDLPLSADAVPVVVCRYDPDARAYTLLPNVRVRSIQVREGPHPATARFEYVFDDSDPDSPYPTQMEETWPIAATGTYTVQADDRLVVLGYTAGGDPRVLFDGFALIPQIDLSPTSQGVTFVAVDVSARCWDDVIAGAVYRHANDPESTSAADQVKTDLPVRFNPDRSAGEPIQPNCTPDDHEVNQGDAARSYPVFLDAALRRVPDLRTSWFIGKTVRHILGVYNTAQEFIPNPDFTPADAYFKAYAPLGDRAFFDPNDPTTYIEEPIVVRDYDADNKAWPDAVWDLVSPHGFSFRFATETDADGFPQHALWFYRKDARDPRKPKTLMLQELGATIDPGRSNVAELHVARDMQSLANAFVVETDPVRYEVSIVLAPLFVIAAGDATNPAQFDTPNLANADAVTRKKYRWFGADETGEGHWSFRSSGTVTTPFDFAPAFGEADATGPSYVVRMRPGESTLISADGEGRPRKAILEFSSDYNGPDPPCFWDGASGTDWQTIDSGWQLLKDRLGIEVTAAKPNAWTYQSKATGTHVKTSGDKLNTVFQLATPSATLPRFTLRLTVVVEADRGIAAEAQRRIASPTSFKIRRRIDAKDHFRKEVVSKYSRYAATPGPNGTDQVARDDTASALAHARALRGAHEFPPQAGSVTIPALVNGYQVGDRIEEITGRGISLQANIGANEGEAPSYPYVVGLTWNFEGQRQSTTLELADFRAAIRRA
jgi:hypothetical protein